MIQTITADEDDEEEVMENRESFRDIDDYFNKSTPLLEESNLVTPKADQSNIQYC